MVSQLFASTSDGETVLWRCLPNDTMPYEEIRLRPARLPKGVQVSKLAWKSWARYLTLRQQIEGVQELTRVANAGYAVDGDMFEPFIPTRLPDSMIPKGLPPSEVRLLPNKVAGDRGVLMFDIRPPFSGKRGTEYSALTLANAIKCINQLNEIKPPEGGSWDNARKKTRGQLAELFAAALEVANPDAQIILRREIPAEIREAVELRLKQRLRKQ